MPTAVRRLNNEYVIRYACQKSECGTRGSGVVAEVALLPQPPMSETTGAAEQAAALRRRVSAEGEVAASATPAEALRAKYASMSNVPVFVAQKPVTAASAECRQCQVRAPLGRVAV